MSFTAFITGATAGFGRATASRLHSQGARIIATGRREDRLVELKEELGGKRIHIVAFDVTNTDDYRASVEALPAEFREIDVLVNNAGMALSRDAFHTVPWENILKMVEVNITGLLAGTRLILPGMVERGRGHVINIGSVAGEWPSPGNAVYGATKAFVRQFSYALRADLLGTPVRISDIEPGMVSDTEFSATRYGGDTSKIAAFYEGMTAMSAEDIAETIAWVISRPPHVNINNIQLMPTDQAFAPLAIHRKRS